MESENNDFSSEAMAQDVTTMVMEGIEKLGVRPNETPIE